MADFGFDADIAFAKDCGHAVAFHFFERLLRFLFRTRIVDRDGQPALGQTYRCRATNACRGTRDQSNPRRFCLRHVSPFNFLKFCHVWTGPILWS